MNESEKEARELEHPGTYNRHGMTGAVLQQPEPPAIRQWAVFDSDKPCIIHSPAYTGNVPLTGAYRCRLCGTSWDDDGKAFPWHGAS